MMLYTLVIPLIVVPHPVVFVVDCTYSLVVVSYYATTLSMLDQVK